MDGIVTLVKLRQDRLTQQLLLQRFVLLVSRALRD